MFNSEIIDVAIGMVFIYVLLALISSAVNEWITSLSRLRSKNLEAGIRNLLNDPEGNALAKKMYEHPLISGLARQKGRPSYIPARSFTRALFDIIAPADPDGKPAVLEDIRKKIADLPDHKLQRSLLILIDDAGDNLQQARKNVEEWFDDAMDRVAGWFKRKTQLIIFLVALLVSVVTNADTFTLANAFWQDDALRQAVASSAVEYQEQNPGETTDPAEKITKITEQMQALQIPVGWEQPLPATFKEWLMKILGLLFTTAAVSLGAPFWFDVLSKVSNLRGSGKLPERTAGQKK
jgi:hypothetical protein